MTWNVLHVGLIALLFPNARVIYCRRNPLDTFISGFFLRFAHPLPHTTGQRQFAHFYKSTERIMAHWRQVLPLKILEIQYEDLVANQAVYTRKILHYLELPWEDSCLDFHLTQRPVLTGSGTQVRKPLYRSSVGRYHRYASHLGDLASLLGMS